MLPVQENDSTNLFIFWAKTTDDKNNSQRQNAFHPLICHLIDVAIAGRAIWENVLTDTQKRRLAKPFKLECDLVKAGKLLSFLIGLHDWREVKYSTSLATRARFNFRRIC